MTAGGSSLLSGSTIGIIYFIIIIIGVLPSGRSLAPIPSTPIFPQLFSSSSQTNLPSDHLSFLFLACFAASFPTFFPPTHPSAVHPSKHMSYPVLLPLVYRLCFKWHVVETLLVSAGREILRTLS